MTDGDKGIPGKVSLRHLKPAAVGGAGWRPQTRRRRAAHQREKKRGLLRRRQPKLGVWGAVRRHMGAKLCPHKELTGVGRSWAKKWPLMALLLSFSLHTLDINPLSDIWFIVIFFYSVGCFFHPIGCLFWSSGDFKFDVVPLIYFYFSRL